MASTPEMKLVQTGSTKNSTLAVLGIVVAVALLHLLTNSRYGFHRDELQTLSDALHLDWGFVAYPPLTPFLERIGLGIFGLSLVGLRFFSVVAQAAAIVVTGLMARELGGGRLAQVTAALVVAFSPCLSSAERSFNTPALTISGGCWRRTSSFAC